MKRFRLFSAFLILLLGIAPAWAVRLHVGPGRALLSGRGAAAIIPPWVQAGFALTCSPANNQSSCYVAGTGLVAYSALFTVSRAGPETVDCNSALTSVGNNVLAVSCNGIQSTFSARTNLLLQSNSLTTTPWVGSAAVVAAPTLTANAATAPDGTLTATEVAFPAVTGTGAVSGLDQSYTGTAATYTDSCYMRGSVGGESLWLEATADAINFVRQQVTLTTSWQRVSNIGVRTAATWFIQFGTDLRDTSQSATPAQTIYAWGCQGELGTDASPLIPTTTVAIARPADNVTPTGLLATILAGSTGTLKIQGGNAVSSVASTIADANGTVLLGKNSSNNGTTAVGTTLTSTNIGEWTFPGNILSLAWDATGGALNTNNMAVVDTTARTPSAPFHMFSTGGSSAFWNGNISLVAAASTKIPGFETNYNLVGVGDSLTSGLGVTTPYPQIIATFLGTSQNNQGTASIGWNWNPSGVQASAPTLLTEESADVCPLVSSLAITPGGAPTIVLFAGTNDIFYGDTAAQTYTSFTTYVTNLIACGEPANHIVVADMLPGAGRSNTTRHTYNADLGAGQSTLGYLRAPLANDPNIGCDTCNLNATLYQADDVHLKDGPGETIEVNIICNAMGAPVCPAYPVIPAAPTGCTNQLVLNYSNTCALIAQAWGQ